MNKSGMKELEPRLRRYCLLPVFGSRVVTNERGSHLDDVYTNIHVSCRNVQTMKGVSDHHKLLCELKINPQDQHLPLLKDKMIKPQPSVLKIRQTLDLKRVEVMIESGEGTIERLIKPLIMKLIQESAWLPNIKAMKPASFRVFEQDLAKVEGEYSGSYLTRKAKDLLTLYDA